MPTTPALALAAAALFVFIPTHPARAADPFTLAGRLPVADAQDVALADFDDDGRSDLAVATRFDGIHVALRRPDGSFAAQPKVATGNQPRQLAVADFDGDGHDDLAVAAATEVDLHLGTGTGSFTAGTTLAGTAAVNALAVGDFDADGREDLAYATSETGKPALVEIRLGDGTGGFAGRLSIKLAATALAVGDVTGDGLEDIVAGGASPALLIGKGLGSFSVVGRPSGSQEGTQRQGLALADTDTDGDLDIVATDQATRAVVLRPNDGGAVFDQQIRVPLEQDAEIGPLVVGDVDGDADVDVAAADTASDFAWLVLGDGTGAWRRGDPVNIGEFPAALALGDLDGDSRTDLVTAAEETVILNRGAGADPLAGNVLRDGGFELDGTPGWVASGGARALRYGAPSHAYFPSRRAAPLFDGGGQFAWGGTDPSGIGTLTQTVDVSDRAAAIDDGRVTAHLSAYLGGARAFADAMEVGAEFRDPDGLKGTAQLSPVGPVRRRNLTTLVREATEAKVPAGTRTIKVVLTARSDDPASSATADNVLLTLDEAPAPEPSPTAAPAGSPAPSPAPVAQAPVPGFGAVTRVSLHARRSGRRVRVRVANGNAFAVSARVRGRALAVAAGGRGTVRLRIPLRRRRLTAVVRDPAGAVRTVRARIRRR